MKCALMITRFALLAIAPALLCPPAWAQDTRPVFSLPLACTPGVDCWVMNYLDLGPEADGKATDPLCGARTYDGNKGTAFALAHKAALEKGVAVRAARAGTVVRIRDTEPDNISPSTADLTAIKDAKKECGNAVLLDHGNGVQTIYCHLKQGSVTRAAGDEVSEGDTVALLGMSGYTSYPQLHFGIVWEGAVMDPFTGLNATDECGTPKQTLWKNPLPYEPVALYAGGFAGEIPTMALVDGGAAAATTLTTDTPVLAFWVTAFGAQQNDTITLTITAPDGTPFSRRTIVQKGHPTRQLYYTGRRLDGAQWMAGDYKAAAVLTRPADEGTPRTWTLARTITLTAP